MNTKGQVGYWLQRQSLEQFFPVFIEAFFNWLIAPQSASKYIFRNTETDEKISDRTV